MMTRRDLLLRYRQTVMGFGWAVFMPVINTIVFSLIFKKVAKIETDVPYPVFAYCGLLPWNMFATSLKTGVNSLLNNKGLLTKVYFPREVFPFSTMLVCVVDFVVGLSVLAVLMLYYWIPLSATALFLPVLIAVQLMFTAGLCMFLAPANLYYRDVKYMLDVLVTVWMFATPVLYPTRHVTGPLGVILQLNPLAPIIDGYRAILLRGELPSADPICQRGGVVVRDVCGRLARLPSQPNIPSRRTPDVAQQPGITFEHVWKRFRRTERHRALRDLIPSLIKRAVRGEHELKRNEFWALKDVSLETRRGEALGIIGPNGAGKSTVLKLLTKILRPTEGRCELRGRVGALIEVAAGFHQDLTGRENVALQGAIMGMKRAEIARKFDQIVEFSGIAGLHRHAGAPLLQRHERSTRLRDRGAPRARGADRRRSAGGRGFRVPAAGVRPHSGDGEPGCDDHHRLTPAGTHCLAVQARGAPAPGRSGALWTRRRNNRRLCELASPKEHRTGALTLRS